MLFLEREKSGAIRHHGKTTLQASGIHPGLEARVGKGLEPGIEPGPEMADRFDKGAAQL
jgi:hypothetical protein